MVNINELKKMNKFEKNLTKWLLFSTNFYYGFGNVQKIKKVKSVLNETIHDISHFKYSCLKAEG